MIEIREFLIWLKAERDQVIKSGKDLGVNTEMLEQHYEKIIRQYTGAVYSKALCNTFEARQN